MCAQNESHISRFGYNSQAFYRKKLEYRFKNSTEIADILEEIQTNNDEYWFSQEDLLEKCALIDTVYTRCKFGLESGEKKEGKFSTIIVAVKGAYLQSFNYSLREQESIRFRIFNMIILQTIYIHQKRC